MRLEFKITTIILCLLVVASFFFYKNNTLAQDLFDEKETAGLICDIPIQVAMPLKQSVELLNFVYKEYQRATGYLSASVQNVQGILGEVSNRDNVCDFSKCRTKPANANQLQVKNVSPEFKLKFNYGLLAPNMDLVKVTLALCVPGECVGDPCSLGSLKEQVKELKALKSLIQASYMNINSFFSEPTELITYELEMPKQGGGTDFGEKTTKQDAILRNMFRANFNMEACALNDLEKQRGGALIRETNLCKEAYENELYWPRPWSEKCQNECVLDYPTQECITCLGQCEGSSILADINCKVYSEVDNKKCGKNEACCGVECVDGLTTKCHTCLERGFSSDGFVDWLCGGTQRNEVCCHKGYMDNWY